MKALSIVLLVASLVLAGCGGSSPIPVFAPAATETEVLPAICGNGLVFTFNEVVELGRTEDYIAYLEANDSVLTGYRLTLLLADGNVFNPAGGGLPEKDESRQVTWGPYVDLTIANCGQIFHYEVKLAGAEAKPVEDPACIPEGYEPDGLKPWPFADFVLVFGHDGDQVFLTSASDADMYLARVRGEDIVEVVVVERPREGETSRASIAVSGGILTVEVKSCSANYFFRATFDG